MTLRPILLPIFPMALAAVQPAQAATTITFNGSTGCRADQTTYCRLPQTHGDTSMVDVSYASVHRDTQARTEMVYRYGVGYGDLQSVVFGRPDRLNYATEVTVSAAQGFELSLLDFDFADFADRAPITPFRISDLGGNVLSESSRVTGAFNTHSTYAVNSAFGSGVIIRWGPDSHEVGLNNIRYEVRAIAAAVPEPTTWAMLILGFGVVGASLRERRAATLKLIY